MVHGRRGAAWVIRRHTNFPGRRPCNDDKDGNGPLIVPDVSGHNVGEPAAHLFDDLDPFFPGHSAWGTIPFYSTEAGANGSKRTAP